MMPRGTCVAPFSLPDVANSGASRTSTRSAFSCVTSRRASSTLIFGTDVLAPLMILCADLASMPEEMIGENDGEHGFAHRHGADADARIVPAGCRDVGILAGRCHGLAR